MRWLAFLPILLSLAGCGPSLQQDEQLLNNYQAPASPESDFGYKILPHEDGELAYRAAGNPNNIALVFIHGTPGKSDNYARYLVDPDLQESAYVVAVDRPGWGRSQDNVSNQRQAVSLDQQVIILSQFVEALNDANRGQGVILIGHSLGASLAPAIAMSSQELVKAMVLLAGTLDPKLGNPRWYNRVAGAPPVNWVLGKSMAKANKEIFQLKDLLNKVEPRWHELNVPITLIQGADDSLVFPENLDYAVNHLSHTDISSLLIEDQGHFLPWEGFELIKIELMKYLPAEAKNLWDD